MHVFMVALVINWDHFLTFADGVSLPLLSLLTVRGGTGDRDPVHDSGKNVPQ